MMTMILCGFVVLCETVAASHQPHIRVYSD